MAVPGESLDLVERFERNREAYRSGRYNETQVRMGSSTRSWRCLVRISTIGKAVPKRTGPLSTRIGSTSGAAPKLRTTASTPLAPSSSSWAYLKGARCQAPSALLVEVLERAEADFSERLAIARKVLKDLRAAERRLMRGQPA